MSGIIMSLEIIRVKWQMSPEVTKRKVKNLNNNSTIFQYRRNYDIINQKHYINKHNRPIKIRIVRNPTKVNVKSSFSTSNVFFGFKKKFSFIFHYSLIDFYFCHAWPFLLMRHHNHHTPSFSRIKDMLLNLLSLKFTWIYITLAITWRIYHAFNHTLIILVHS